MSKKKGVKCFLDESEKELVAFPRHIDCNLYELQLCNNAIITIPPTISHLTRLTVLNLSNNYIKEIPDCVRDLVSLEKLYMQNNCLKRISSHLVALTRLWEVSLIGNPDLPCILSVAVMGSEDVEKFFRALCEYHATFCDKICLIDHEKKTNNNKEAS